jgi:uncharacterized short protein YbdD (DUF466 family)
MRRAWEELSRGVRRVWQGLREWSGDAAYEKYVQCIRRIGGGKPLTPAEFYVEQLNRRYARPNRCC